MPSQLKQRIPWFSFCENLFTAYDPPTALRSAPALAPVITPDSDPQIQKPTAAPSHTIDFGARKTAAKKVSRSVPMTASLAQKTPSLPTDVDPESNSDPKQGTKIGQSGDVSGDPGIPADPKVPGLPLQSVAAVNSNQDPNQKTSPIVQNEPKQNDNGDPIGNDSGPKAAGASQIADPETATLEDTNSASKPPNELPQRILTTIAGHAITANPTAVAIAGTTLGPGDSAITVGGTPLALDTAGRYFLLGSKTIPFETTQSAKPLITTIAGQTITANPTAVTVAGTTLGPGDSAITVGGTPVALDPAGHYILLGSKTIPFETTESAKPLIATIAGQTITAVASAIAIAGTTLRKGDKGFEINGTVISLDTAGSFVVGSKTQTFDSGSVDSGGSTVGVSGSKGPLASTTASVVQSGVSNRTDGAAATGVQVFTGEAGGLRCNLLWIKVVVAITAGLVW